MGGGGHSNVFTLPISWVSIEAENRLSGSDIPCSAPVHWGGACPLLVSQIILWWMTAAEVDNNGSEQQPWSVLGERKDFLPPGIMPCACGADDGGVLHHILPHKNRTASLL